MQCGNGFHGYQCARLNRYDASPDLGSGNEAARVYHAVVGAAATWPLAARAQQPAGRVYRIGYQSIPSREQQLHLIKAFEDGLRSLGYRVGENVVIEYRFSDAQMERLPALAADLVRLGVDIIVATGSIRARSRP